MSLAELLKPDVYTPYMWYSERVKSFTANWPHHGSRDFSPEKMATAGLYYNPRDGGKDIVTCPFCLRSWMEWEEGHDPLTVHEKVKNRCFFVRLGKNEADWTNEDIVLLLAQRRASKLASDVLETIGDLSGAIEKVHKLSEEKQQKKPTKRQ